MNRSRRCEAVFAAVQPGSLPQDVRLSANALLLHSYPGDRVGEGRRVLLLDSLISADAYPDPVTGARTVLQVAVYDVVPRWSLWLQTPAGKQLAPGVYESAGAYGVRRPGIFVGRGGLVLSCAADDPVSGRFTIHEITFASPTSETVTALALDFEQRCTPTSPPLQGSIRLNSSRAEVRPFVSTGSSARVPFDLNSDGATDLLWQNRDDGRLMFWHMNGAIQKFNESLTPGQVADRNWHIVGGADANRDGYSDLYWQHQTTGALAIWYMRGHVLVSGDALSPGSSGHR